MVTYQMLVSIYLLASGALAFVGLVEDYKAQKLLDTPFEV